MRTVRSAAAMQRLARAWRRKGVRVALVPTMGCLHDGHLSLVHRARKAAGPRGMVVVSLYVNPAQFGANEDLSRYPRDLPRDTRLCRGARVDVLFAPEDVEMYPNAERGRFSTFVDETALSRPMEGRARPTHFRGVATIVAKLLNLVLPDVAVFGAKDFQQAAVVKRLVRDLNFPTAIVVTPTVRERDGLALSSRNKYLGKKGRRQAAILWRAIRHAQARVRAGTDPVSSGRLKRELQRLIASQPAARLDYAEFFDPETLAAAPRVSRGTHLALAVFIGGTRLIDNGRM